MPLWNMIPAAISGAKAVYGLLNKPKKSDFTDNRAIDQYQNMITENRNNIEGKSLSHSMMKPAIRQSAIARERNKRGIAERLAQGQLTEGQAQAAETTSNTNVDAMLTDQQDKSTSAQIQQNQQDKSSVDKARIEIGRLKDEGRKRFEQAQAQNNAEIFGAGLDAVAGGVSAFMQNSTDEALKTFSEGALDGIDFNDSDAVSGAISKIYLYKQGLLE